MRTLIDRLFGTHFIGTRGDDRMIGGGTAGQGLLGGDGNDDINPGINPSQRAADRVDIYGGVALPGFGPKGASAGAPGAIGGLHNDGDDILHGGSNIRATGGSGADTYVAHGPIREGMKVFSLLRFNPHEGDTIVLDNSRGQRIEDIDVYRTWTEDGKKYLHLQGFDLIGLSRNPAIGEQHLRVGFGDDYRGVHTETVIEWSGRSYADDVRAWVAEADFIL